jgi:hypothetical protein
VTFEIISAVTSNQQVHRGNPFKAETQLWRLPPNSEFEDVNGQVFRKTGATAVRRKIKKHEVVCLASPYTEPPGPVSAAFFTHVGATLWLPGSQNVLVRANSVPSD